MSSSDNSFDRKKILSKALQSNTQPLPEALRTTHTMSIIRHGKTRPKDNESMASIDPTFKKDPPKGKDTPLHPEEYNPTTSTLYQQALAIKNQGFTKVTLYHAGDTVRNTESTKLMKQYLSDLGISVTFHNEHIPELSARKKRELSEINELHDQGHITQDQLDKLNFGQKHVIGNTKSIDLSEHIGKKLYEESYTETINNAGTGIKKTQNIITQQPSDPDTLHLIVAYRTTLQAADIQQDKVREKKGIDLHYSGPFAEMKHYPLTQNGNFQLRESEKSGKHLINIPLDQYDDLVEKLSKILPDISPDQGFQTNNNILNQYVYHLESFIEERLTSNHTNIICHYLEQYPLIGEVMMGYLCKLLSHDQHKNNTEHALYNFLQKGFANLDQKHQFSCLQQLYQTSNTSLRKTAFAKTWASDRDFLRNNIGSNEDFDNEYKKIHDREEFLGSNIFMIDSGRLGTRHINDIYIPQNISMKQKSDNINYQQLTQEGAGRKKQWSIKRIDSMEKIIQTTENLFISGAGGTGKTTLSKKILYDLVSQHKILPSDISLKNAQTTTFEDFTTNKILLIDGFDEADETKQKELIQLIQSTKNIKIICLGRTFPCELSSVSGIREWNIETQDAQGTINHIKKQLPPSKREQYHSFMSFVLPHIHGENNNHLLIKMLGGLCFSRQQYNIKQGEFTKSDIYDLYINTLYSNSFTKMANIDTTIYDNPYMGEEYDKTRSSFMEYITSLDNLAIIGSSNILDHNNLNHIVQSFTQQSKNPQQSSLNTQHFIESLIFSGLCHKKGNTYHFRHKNIIDHFRHKNIPNIHALKQTAIYHSLLQGTLPEETLYSILDAIFFNGYETLPDVIDHIYTHSHSKPHIKERTLLKYISRSSGNIVSYFSEKMRHKYPTSTNHNTYKNLIYNWLSLYTDDDDFHDARSCTFTSITTSMPQWLMYQAQGFKLGYESHSLEGIKKSFDLAEKVAFCPLDKDNDISTEIISLYKWGGYHLTEEDKNIADQLIKDNPDKYDKYKNARTFD